MSAPVFLFDLDGTLIDSIELIRTSYAWACRAHGLAEPGEEHWLEGLGRPLAWQFGRYSADPDVVAAMTRTYREHNLARHDALVRAYPGVCEALDALAARGRLGVVTSKGNASAARGLAVCGLEGRFEVVIGADDVPRHKPDPLPVVAALERLGAGPERAVYVGDSPHDLACGRAAGVRTAAVGWGPFPEAGLRALAPDAWIAEPKELVGLAALLEAVEEA